MPVLFSHGQTANDTIRRPADDPSLIYRDDTLAPDGTYNGHSLLHVLILGVSAYPNGRFRPLSSTVASALKMYDWIIEQGYSRRSDKMPEGWLCARLGTVRMLLSPSQLEPLTAQTQVEQLETPAVTLENVKSAVKKWIESCSRSEEDFALFYYAGHGLQRDQNDQTLLLNDFAGEEDFQATTLAFPSIVNGMTPSSASPVRAGTQFYFVDACRDTPELVNRFYDIQAYQLYGPRKDARPVKVAAPVFFAAQPGQRAQALEQDQTLFSKALLKALRGDAAEPRTFERNDRRRKFWHVTYSGVNKRLGDILTELNREYGANQDRITSGAGDDAPLCYLEEAPVVPFEIVVQPGAAVPSASIVLKNGSGKLLEIKPDVQEHPYRHPLKAQNCIARVECERYNVLEDDQVRIMPIDGRRWEAALESRE